MPGTPSTADDVRRTPTSPLSALTPRRRALVTAGAVAALALGGLVAAPRSDLPGAAAASSEREVVSVDVDGADDPVALSAVLTSAKVRATAKTTSRSATGRWITASASRMPTLRPGDRGRAIAFVQRRLHVTPTGYYGRLTLAAVVAFQRGHGLPARGIVGPMTWRALVSSRPTARTAPRPPAAAPRVSAPVTAGRVCPAPGASFGDGFGVARSGHRHQGMDLMGRRGMPILAIEDGVVIREGIQSNGALRIVLQGRSGSKFFYGHMSKDLVHAGSRVKRGQVIGLMGDTGSPGAVHLHFEYWRSGGESAAVDPAPLLHSLC